MTLNENGKDYTFDEPKVSLVHPEEFDHALLKLLLQHKTLANRMITEFLYPDSRTMSTESIWQLKEQLDRKTILINHLTELQELDRKNL